MACAAAPRRTTAALAVALGALGAAAGPAGAARLDREVFAYYPSWEWSRGTSGWRWDLLSIVGYFSVGMRADGTVASLQGWTDGAGPPLVAEAHAHGVRVVLVVTIFDTAAIHGALTTGRATAIQTIVDAVVEGGGDGVNLDFEGLAAADRDALVAFVFDLGRALRDAAPGAHLSLATPAVDWSGAWDYAGLTDPGAADALMIMGYDYHWKGSEWAGPVAPLTAGDLWSERTVTWTVDDYLAKVGAERRARLLLGVPLYGIDWPTESDAVPSRTLADGTSVLYRVAEVDAVARGRRWDAASQTPYYVYSSSGTWHQVWYDDAESLRAKFELVTARDLAGVGVWALDYQGESGAFWEAVESRLTEVDAGPPDAELPPDAAPPAADAAAGPDAGADEPPDDPGCACRAAGRGTPRGAGGGCAIALAALGALARRRGRRGRRA